MCFIFAGGGFLLPDCLLINGVDLLRGGGGRKKGASGSRLPFVDACEKLMEEPSRFGAREDSDGSSFLLLSFELPRELPREILRFPDIVESSRCILLLLLFLDECD